jgi:hypothetical protein
MKVRMSRLGDGVYFTIKFTPALYRVLSRRLFGSQPRRKPEPDFEEVEVLEEYQHQMERVHQLRREYMDSVLEGYQVAHPNKASGVGDTEPFQIRRR